MIFSKEEYLSRLAKVKKIMDQKKEFKLFILRGSLYPFEKFA